MRRHRATSTSSLRQRKSGHCSLEGVRPNPPWLRGCMGPGGGCFLQRKRNRETDPERTVHEPTTNVWRTDVLERTQNKRLRTHDRRLRTHDEIVQSRIHFSVHVAFSYCSVIAFRRICRSIKALISSSSSSALHLVQHIQTSLVLQSFIVRLAYL